MMIAIQHPVLVSALVLFGIAAVGLAGAFILTHHLL